MKADMDEHGVIILTPETNVEAYALRHWAHESLVEMSHVRVNEQVFWRGSRLIVKGEIE